jgi:hypothetical protein
MKHPAGLIGIASGALARYADLISSMVGLQIPEGSRYLHGKEGSVAKNYNRFAREFLANPKLQWLCLIEDDHVLLEDALLRLLHHQKPVVSALYLHKHLPFEPILYERMDPDGRVHTRFLKDGESGLVAVASVPNGCIVIRREVIQAISDPWWTYETAARDEMNHDVMFSKRVREAGFQLWCDLDLIVGHNGVVTVFPYRNENGEWLTRLRIGDGDIFLPAAQPKTK